MDGAVPPSRAEYTLGHPKCLSGHSKSIWCNFSPPLLFAHRVAGSRESPSSRFRNYHPSSVFHLSANMNPPRQSLCFFCARRLVREDVRRQHDERFCSTRSRRATGLIPHTEPCPAIAWLTLGEGDIPRADWLPRLRGRAKIRQLFEMAPLKSKHPPARRP